MSGPRTQPDYSSYPSPDLTIKPINVGILYRVPTYISDVK